MKVSVVVETWNTREDQTELERLLDRLTPQVRALDAELVVTHVGLPSGARDDLARTFDLAITWRELSAGASYYDHKNEGFAASTGDVVAFIDGDCTPCNDWLAALTAPFCDGTDGARVVAGATAYPGSLAALASELDFPYYEGPEMGPEMERAGERWRAGTVRMRRFAATSSTQARAVRNFFANNVAFSRGLFTAHGGYPDIAPMFHGQCQVLALALVRGGIPIAYAAEARVTHAWPTDASEWLRARLLRGADTTQLLPYVLAAYAPHLVTPARRLGPVPTLALLGLRAATGTVAALRGEHRLRGLALVAGVTAVDSVGALAAPVVHRYLAR